MSTPTTAEARFAPDGTIRVLAFTWQGRRLAVTGQGRQWPADDGQHLLVMVPGERVFELAFSEATGQWRVVKAPGGAAVV